jgi:hypothetical protein
VGIIIYKSKMVNYSNGKIYKLVNNVDDKIYVGSTCELLRVRKYKHNYEAKTKPSPAHIHFNQIGWNNVDIILIEAFECKNKDELLVRERHWIDELKSELNTETPGRKMPEWREDNKEQRLQYNKDRYALKKVEILTKQKAYYEKNKNIINAKLNVKTQCECGGKYLKKHKANHMKTQKHLNHQH